MKNILLFPLLFTCFAAFAQEKTEVPRPPIRFSMEVMSGLMLANMPIHFKQSTGEYNPDYVFQAGFYAGLAGRVSFTSRWAGLIEGQYAQKGFGVQNSPFELRFRYDFVEAMPQVDYKIIPQLSVSLGTFAAIRMAAYHQTPDGGDWEKTSEDFVYVKNVDFGFVSGLTGHFGRFRAYARYQHGLLDLSKLEFTNDSGMNLQARQRSRSLQLGVGYRFL